MSMHRLLAVALAWLLFAALNCVQAQQFQAGGIYGNPTSSRAAATDATLQALINQNSPLTLPNASFTGTIGAGATWSGNPTFSGNLTFNGTIAAPNLAVPGSIASSVCQDSSGNFLTNASANCFGGGGGGSGTVNSGTINQLAWYAGTGTAVSGLATANNGVLVTSSGGVPSIGSTLPSAVQGNITSLGTIATGTWQGTAVGLAYGGLGGSQSAATANQFPVFPGSGGAAVPTSFATFLSNVCSSSIGQYWVQLSGGWGCTSIGWANPVWWGADSTGSSDSASAFNSALSASAIVRFPPGTFKLNSAISFTYPATAPWSQTVECAGSGATTLKWPNSAGGLTMAMSNVQHSARVAHCRFASSQAGTATGLTISNSSCLGTFAMNTFQDLMFNGDDNGTSHYWSIGALVNGVSGTTWFDDTFYGPVSGTSGTGLKFSSPSSCSSQPASSIYHYVVMDTINQEDVAISFGNGTQGLFVNTINIQNGFAGIQVPSGATGALTELSVFGSQISTAGHGIDVEVGVGLITIIGNLITPATNHTGVLLNNNGIDNAIVSGNFVLCGATSGVAIYTKGNYNLIGGNWLDSCAAGVEIDSTGTNNLVVGNLVPTATNAVLINGNSSTTQNNFVTSNLLTGSGSAVDLSSTSKGNVVWGNLLAGGSVVNSGSSNTVGQACSGTPSASFASVQGIVTHC